MELQIREALPEEHEEAGRVTAGAYREFVPPGGDPDWDEYLGMIADVPGRAARTQVLVVVDGDRIVGSATLELDSRVEEWDGPLRPHEAHIRMLGILAEMRGRGAGRALMAECERRAREAGKQLMTLHTTQKMTVAQRMYESLGYSKSEDHVFPDGFVLLGYSKEL